MVLLPAVGAMCIAKVWLCKASKGQVSRQRCTQSCLVQAKAPADERFSSHGFSGTHVMMNAKTPHCTQNLFEECVCVHRLNAYVLQAAVASRNTSAVTVPKVHVTHSGEEYCNCCSLPQATGSKTTSAKSCHGRPD